MTVTEVRVFHLDGQQFRLMHDMVASRYDYQALRQDLRYIDKRIDDFASPSNFSRVVFEVLDSADRQGWLPELLQRFKESDFDEVRKMASEILVQHSSMPAASTASGSSDTPPSFPESESHAGPGGVSGETNPYGTYLIGQRPFIDRSRLRTCLKDLLSETSDSRVLMINGERPCGKSYTWFFIKQPGLLEGISPVLVDLSEYVDSGRPIDIMTSIALQLRLEKPSIDKHAPGATQARNLRDWLVGQLGSKDPDQRWLLVFDSLDHLGQRDETLQLIEFLAGAAIRQLLAGLRVILLGYTNRLSIDPGDSVLTEEICDIGESELREFFKSLAERANEAIRDDAVDIAVRKVLSELPDDRDRKLRQLPMVVRKVGNATFGRTILQ